MWSAHLVFASGENRESPWRRGRSLVIGGGGAERSAGGGAADEAPPGSIL